MSQVIKKSDSTIKHDVSEELKWDSRVKETDVGVEVKEGVVTLTGTVASWAERLAALEAAHRVAGVLDVANDIRVHLPGSREKTDTDIARAVRHALEWDVLVPHDRIRTTVSNGVVTLEGEVAYWSEHDDAARCVKNLAGVIEVRNLIAVEAPRMRVAPTDVRHAIESTLERRADRAAERVQIVVVDDKVILTGAVPSLGDRAAIEGAARSTPGVHKVDNQLRIQP